MKIRCDRYADEKNLTDYFWDVHLPECKKCQYWFESVENAIPPSDLKPGGLNTDDGFFLHLPDLILKRAKKRVWTSRILSVAATVAVFIGVSVLAGYLVFRQGALVPEDGYELLGYFNADTPDFLRYGQDGEPENTPDWDGLIEDWSTESGFPDLKSDVPVEEIDEWYQSMKNEETGG